MSLALTILGWAALGLLAVCLFCKFVLIPRQSASGGMGGLAVAVLSGIGAIVLGMIWGVLRIFG